jgi:hypothetical protein
MTSVESAKLAGVDGRPLRARRVIGSGMVVLSGAPVDRCEQSTGAGAVITELVVCLTLAPLNPYFATRVYSAGSIPLIRVP